MITILFIIYRITPGQRKPDDEKRRFCAVWYVLITKNKPAFIMEKRFSAVWQFQLIGIVYGSVSGGLTGNGHRSGKISQK